jgi:hypothetical protein
MCRSSTKGRAKGRGCGRQLLGGRSSGWLLPGGCDWLLLLRSSDWSGWLLRSSGWLLCSNTGAHVAARPPRERVSGAKSGQPGVETKKRLESVQSFLF